MNRLILMLIFAGVLPVAAQTTLEQCWKAARENYPVIRQYALIEQARDYDLRNAKMAQIPQVNVSGKASYQTTVTSVPIPSITPMSKDQYQVMAEVTQSIWDGGMVNSQKRSISTAAEVDVKSTDVDLYALNERVNSLFFGVMTLDEQLKLNMLLDEELNRNHAQVKSYISGGIANGADLDAVQVALLSNRQKRAAIEASREAYLNMLSEMVGFKVESIATPQMPASVSQEIRRPELSLFDSQINQVEIGRDAISARNMPKIGAFVQGAYGNPGLDMFKSGFTPYAIGGVQVKWNIGSLYTRKNDLQKIEVQKMMVETQRSTFLYNTNLLLTQSNGEIERIKKQMEDDDKIIELRGNIKQSAEAKVAQGTMTVIEMLREVTAENSAIQTKLMHGVELLKTIYDIKYKTNN